MGSASLDYAARSAAMASIHSACNAARGLCGGDQARRIAAPVRVTTRASDQQLISDASTLSPGQQITTRLARGRVTSRVESIEQNASHTNHTASDKE